MASGTPDQDSAMRTSRLLRYVDGIREQLMTEGRKARKRISAPDASQTGHNQAVEPQGISEEWYRRMIDRAGEAIVVVQDEMVRFSNARATEITGRSREELASKPFAELIHPEDRESVLALCLRTAGSGEHGQPCQFRVIDSGGSARWVEGCAAVLTWEGQPATLAFFSDITERKVAEDNRASRIRSMEALREVGQAMNETMELPGLLDCALGRVVDTMGADIGFIYMLDTAGRAFSLVAYSGLSEEDAQHVSHVKLEEDELQDVLHCRDPYVALLQVRGQSALRLVAEALEAGSVRCFTAVQLSVNDELQGILAIASRSRPEFNREDIDLLSAIGDEIAVRAENAKLFQRTRELSLTDELTGLYNRRQFYGLLEVEMNRSQRDGRSFSLAMLDLDGFKAYNDRFGHIAGDEVLESFARMLQSSLRRTDIAFRYGGDEFAVIMPATNAPTASSILGRIRSKWPGASMAKPSNVESRLGFSAGIGQFTEDAETGDGLVFLADSALLRSKRMGGHRSTLVSEMKAASIHVTGRAMPGDTNEPTPALDPTERLAYVHSRRLPTLSEAIGKAIELPSYELVNLRRAALLHDIGMLLIPHSILAKPDKPTEQEWMMIRRHPAEGANMVGSIERMERLVPLIRHHHERYDGTGYPDGLKGHEIPLGARILSVADAYDTMTTSRPYRQIMSREEAFEELRRCAGTQFDPQIVEAFCRAMRGDSRN